MATSGNQKRTREKNKCRRALADHINERLGLQVHPDKVRLRPRPEDQYRWFVAEPMRKYFQSNLSGGSLGGFQKICEALQHGNLIEAVPVNNSRQDDSKSEDKYYSTAPDQSFTTTIQRLEQNNRQARLEYEISQEKAQKERLDAEQRELQWKTVAEQYEVRLKEMREKIIPALHTLTLHLSQYFDLEDLESRSANGSGIVDHVEP